MKDLSQSNVINKIKTIYIVICVRDISQYRRYLHTVTVIRIIVSIIILQIIVNILKTLIIASQ